MSQFEYVSVLTSLILGLGVTQILTKAADIILVSNKVKFYGPHTFWVLIIFGLHIQEWWINFEYSRVIMDWNILNFFFLISYPLVLFIIARLLFPYSIKDESLDLKKFFNENVRSIFAIALFLPIISIPQNILIGYSIFDQAVQIIISFIFLYFILSKTKSEILHYLFAVGFMLLTLGYTFFINPPL